MYSLPFSTSSHFCSLSSCLFVLVRTSALSHRDSSIATSKGASPRFWSCALLATSVFPFHDPTPTISFVHVLLSTFRILMPYDLASWVYSSCPHESVRCVSKQRLFRNSILPSLPLTWDFVLYTGERLSPYVALACVAMAVKMILS